MSTEETPPSPVPIDPVPTGAPKGPSDPSATADPVAPAAAADAKPAADSRPATQPASEPQARRKKAGLLKWIVRVGVAAVLLLVVGLVVLYFVMDGILRSQIQQQSAKSLNLGTQLDKAAFKPFSGQLSLAGFRVDSPPGFAQQPMIDLGGLDVKVAYKELTSNPIRIEEIAITKPRMLLEHKDGKFNLKAMAENLPGQQPAPAPPPGPPQPAPQPQPPQQPPPQQPAPPAEPAEQKRLIIGQIVVRDAVVVLRPGVPNLLKEQIEIPIETFTMAGIGNAEGATNGAAIQQVVTQLATTLAAKAKATDLARQFLPAELSSILDGDLTGVASKYIPGEAGKAVTSLLTGVDVRKDPTKAIGRNAAGLVDEQIGNIVGPAATQQFGGVQSLLGGALDDKKKKEEEKKKKDEERRKKEREK